MKNRVVYFLLSLGLLTGLGLLVLHRAQIKFYILQKASRFWPHDATILCALGKLYYKGNGTTRSVKCSFECFQKAAVLNNPKALYKLGNLHCHRYQIEKGPEADPFFWNSIPFNLREALRCYRKAASMNYRSAYTRLGFFSFTGLGTDRNYREALYWYSKAAHLGSSRAQYWVGYLYAHAPSFNSNETLSDLWDDVPLNYKKALKWFTKAAEQGEAEAQCWLGYLYSHGGGFMDRPQSNRWSLTGIEPNLDMAIEWYTKAAEQGDETAQYHLGYLYLRNCGGSLKQIENAHTWLTKAASKGCRFAQRLLGSMYELGEGVPMNHKQALEWYTKAAEQGDYYATKYRAEMLAKKHTFTGQKLLALHRPHDLWAQSTVLT